jgi:hypothetical protein
MKIYVKASTRKKRIARIGEFDNGRVFHGDWKEMTDEEAESKAKEASQQNPGEVFYVQYDDIMNPSSDIYWVNGADYRSYQDALRMSKLHKQARKEAFGDE